MNTRRHAATRFVCALASVMLTLVLFDGVAHLAEPPAGDVSLAQAGTTVR